jgi:DNA-binding transcriptional LysR family regulator
MLAMMAARRGLAAIPLSDARVIERVLRGVVAIPLIDADPAILSLVWREADHNPCVQALIATAGQLASSDGAGHHADGRPAAGAQNRAGSSRRPPTRY